MTPEDLARLDEIRLNMVGRTHYEGQIERTDEFMLRLLDEERARCANIVERHPDEKHPHNFDPERIRGCCELMAARIRDGDL